MVDYNGIHLKKIHNAIQVWMWKDSLTILCTPHFNFRVVFSVVYLQDVSIMELDQSTTNPSSKGLY